MENRQKIIVQWANLLNNVPGSPSPHTGGWRVVCFGDCYGLRAFNCKRKQRRWANQSNFMGGVITLNQQQPLSLKVTAMVWYTHRLLIKRLWVQFPTGPIFCGTTVKIKELSYGQMQQVTKSWKFLMRNIAVILYSPFGERWLHRVCVIVFRRHRVTQLTTGCNTLCSRKAFDKPLLIE